MTTQADDVARLLTAINAENLLPDEPVTGDNVLPILRTLRRAKEVQYRMHRLLMAVAIEDLLPADGAGGDIIVRILQVLRDAKNRRAFDDTMSTARSVEVTIKPGTFTGPPEAAAEFARAVAAELAGLARRASVQAVAEVTASLTRGGGES